MEYFAPESVGKTRSKTPEGFLICHNVPVGRIGEMLYSPKELRKYEPAEDGMIHVYRYREQLFRPETLASFEGKPTTDDHPPGGDMMDPKTFRKYATGHGQNIRAGTEEFPDCIVADLLVMDEEAIRAIEEDDKVQISVGYDARYVKVGPGRYEQHDIVGNHFAFVFAGRCGPRCAVGDTAPCLCEGACNCQKGKKMPKPNIKDALKSTAASLAALQQTLDEAPNVENEGGTHVHLHMAGGGTDDIPALKDKRSKDGNPPDNNEGKDKITQMLDSLMGRMNTIEDALYDMSEDSRIGVMRDKRFKDAGETEEEMKARKEREAKDRKAARDRRAKDNTPEGGTENPLANDKRNKDGEMTEEEKKKAEEAKDRRMRDGEATEEELKKLEGKTTDAAHNSASLEAEFTRVLEQVAILSPGLSTPTFDAMNHVATTAKSLCNMRRNSLRNALQREDTKIAISGIVDSVKTLDAMPCAAVRAAFAGAFEIVRQKNNSTAGNALSRVVQLDPGTGKGVRTAKQINEENARKWGRPV